MNKIAFPFGKTHIEHDFSEENLKAVLVSSIEEYTPTASPVDLVEQAVANPIGSKSLYELAKGKNKVVIIASDHTRPVPSRVIMPIMLREVRRGNPNADITILIATGCHRGTTKEELIEKFGEKIVENEKIYIHDCLEEDKYAHIGTLPSGGECIINSIAHSADLLIAEGFIEPHFFAGFSGGRKSLLPGVCSRETVLANHCSEFIDSPYARTGILENNPIHADMVWAAKKANLAFIVNVVLGSKKEVIYAVAGDLEAAHKKGTNFLKDLCGAKACPADIVISTNSGYPLDRNIYQAVKGMTAAEATVKQGGVIIMLARSEDGMGGDHFYKRMASSDSLQKTMDMFLARGRGETEPDQWMSQIFVRILMRATVIYVSEADDKIVRDMKMIPAHSLDEALCLAKEILGKTSPEIVAIPDGVSVVVR